YWTTPKTANLSTTTPASYDLRYSTSLITDSNFSSASPITTLLTPSVTTGTVATSTVSGLATSTAYYFAVKTNNGSNDSGISNVYTATTEDGNYTTLAGYPVSGIIASSTSPYIITADITIPASGTFSLVIQPGAVVKMSGVRNIILSANTTLTIGSASDAINAAVVTSKDDNSFSTPASGSDGTPGAGDWNRITMSSGSISMNNSIIRYGGNAAGMVQMTGGSTSITRSILEWSNNYAITLGNDSTALTLSNSTIQNNNEGIGISTSANATISGTTFTGNHRGIAIGTTADEANLSITGNNFYANNRVFGATVFAGIHYSDTTGTLTAENNWWGSVSGPTTASPDSDDTRDAAMADTTAVIDYTPYATSAFTILPSNL
ncbi:MAG: right-handed parallel beta-helix repeat-containing protein, partial [Patescibacteria group bacterium]